MRDKGAYNPSGSFANLMKRAKKINKTCLDCETGLINNMKKRCGPCSDKHYQERVHKYMKLYNALKAAKDD